MRALPRSVIVRRYRGLVTLGCAVVAALAVLGSGFAYGPGDGRLYDLALAVRAALASSQPQSPVAVVALDRRSLDSEELRDTPRVFLGPYWAKALDSVFAAGARSVGFDIIFAYSAGRFRAIDPNYDWPFSDALARHRERLALGRSLQTTVADAYRYPLMDPRVDAPDAEEPSAIGYVELFADGDGVHRWFRRDLPVDAGDSVPSLAAATLARAGGPPMPERVLIAPHAPLEAMPAYSLVDVLRCAKTAPGRLAEAFAGKIVMVGGVLAEEDRKAAPDRFIRAPAPAPVAAASEGCALAPLGPSNPDSDTVPGVFLHAAAVAAVASGDLVVPAGRPARLAATVGAALGGAALAFALSPWWAVALAVVSLLALFTGEVVLLLFGAWLPMIMPTAALMLALVAAYLARFIVEQRKRRRVQHAFGHFLSPVIVDRLVEESEELRLGGERREVTVLFADLSGFTALSGRVGPEVLMAVTNRYLALIADAVDATGGYVDKFIGDAVMAVWGAPAGDPSHAQHACRAALLALDRIQRAAAEDRARGEPAYSVKIGINSGAAVVGNVGAERRYNYTAVGEVVNIASRLEGLPGDYACSIIVGPATAAQVGRAFVLCELDRVKVKGKAEPIAVHELLCAEPEAGERERAYVAAYSAALSAWRDGRFAEAEATWRATAHPRRREGEPSPPTVMAGRAAAMKGGASAGWDGVRVKTTKGAEAGIDA